jgi:GntR family phosphonate transport system transcriptional regulator
LGRPALWTSIRDRLSDEIAKGHYAPGDRLPTEAQLADRFGVNRHTVRRALADLSEQGTVHARRGAGVFVQHRQMPYPIGKRVRFHQNLWPRGACRISACCCCKHVPPARRKPSALDLSEGRARPCLRGAEPVRRRSHRAVPVGLSGGAPARHVGGACGTPARSRPPSRHTGSPTTPGANRNHGETGGGDARRAVAAVARRADPAQRGVNVDPDGIALEYGRTWFAGDRVTLTLGADAP